MGGYIAVLLGSTGNIYSEVLSDFWRPVLLWYKRKGFFHDQSPPFGAAFLISHPADTEEDSTQHFLLKHCGIGFLSYICSPQKMGEIHVFARKSTQ